ncbi:hypothetical protein [Pseudonocardia sp. McavD-2-B]|uniref:hypothetical protein n=1 Tax=Pseudonocardia sp. McavD-2-B TaxID=2954499 RepID=UPI002098518E|nr:hypothetical protein [Pseudonocardia sp. McavD-2-B]MCO7193189.1 hypothetical protein [Pseudonocardia sp. McavD-2-B]
MGSTKLLDRDIANATKRLSGLKRQRPASDREKVATADETKRTTDLKKRYEDDRKVFEQHLADLRRMSR